MWNIGKSGIHQGAIDSADGLLFIQAGPTSSSSQFIGVQLFTVNSKIKPER
jgi:hypothetical protein